jgi:hypothetical protein
MTGSFMLLNREEKTMAEKKFKQVCKCENCGNEAEMMITCSLEDHKEPLLEPSPVTEKKDKTKGHAVCSHCGNEADMWIDLP